jgi:hypothetical protein
LKFYDAERGARLLNPEMVRKIKYGGKSVRPSKLSIPLRHLSETVSHGSVRISSQKKQPEIDIKFDLHKPAERATLAILLEPAGESTGETESEVTAFLDGEKVELKAEQQKGRWGWYTFNVRPGKHTSRLIIAQREKENEKENMGNGKASVEENGDRKNGAWPHFPHVIVAQGEKRNGWTGKVSVWLVCSQRPDGMEVSFDLAQSLGKKRPMPPRPWPSGELRRTVKLG